MKTRRLWLRWLGKTIALALLVATMPRALARDSWILWNTSPSLPEGLYRRVHEPIRPGAIVAACLPEAIARVALERNYLLPGSRCPGGAAPILKRVAAVEGMWVERRADVISIDEVPWQRGEIERYDSHGRRVPWQVRYPYGVPEGRLLLLGERAGSFDGRYFGTLAVDDVIGVYMAVWSARTR